jgi:heme-degrading monooxygenase HmoA
MLSQRLISIMLKPYVMAAPPPLAVAELTPDEAKALARKHPEMARAGGRSAVAITGEADLVDSVVQAVRRLSHGPTKGSAVIDTVLALMAHEPGNREHYIDVLMASLGVADRSELPQLIRNARRRAELLRDFEGLTSAQVADLRGSTAGNRAAIASRWKSERRVFSVRYQKSELYPAFQFDEDGEPRPVIRRILEAIEGRDGWALALWFTAANGWLDDKRPVDLLDKAKREDDIVEAARRSFEPLAV